MYAECPAPPGLAAVVQCVWRHAPPEACEHRVVPDGCVDLIWLAGEFVVADPDRSHRMVALPAAAETAGVRLRRRGRERRARQRTTSMP